MTAQQLRDARYAAKQSAVRAMWAYVRQLQRMGIHTGALSGDNGTCAQWVDNNGRTHRASIYRNDGYYTADGAWRVNLSDTAVDR